MMRILRDGIWLCSDCVTLQETGDATSFQYHYGNGEECDGRILKCQRGLMALGPNLVPDNNPDTGEEHRKDVCKECDSCHWYGCGEWHRYSALGDGDPEFLLERTFAPYLEGAGPKFLLRLFDMNHTRDDGKYQLFYELWQENGPGYLLIFRGSDFWCSPFHAVDSEETVRSLMTFLTLRPGDTDKEYFDSYTKDQLAFCEQHAEAMSQFATESEEDGE